MHRGHLLQDISTRIQMCASAIRDRCAGLSLLSPRAALPGCSAPPLRASHSSGCAVAHRGLQTWQPQEQSKRVLTQTLGKNIYRADQDRGQALMLQHSSSTFQCPGKLLLTPPTKHTVKPKSATTTELKARTRQVHGKKNQNKKTKLSWKCKESFFPVKV